MDRKPVLLTAASAVLIITATVGAAGATFGGDEPTKEEVVEAATQPKFPADDGPSATDSQRELAQHTTEWTVPRDEIKGAPSAAPWFLREGIVGFAGAPAEGYTMYVGADADRAAVTSQFTEGLSAAAQKWLTVVVSDNDANAIADTWEFVQSGSWTDRKPTYDLTIDPGAGVVVMNLDSPRNSELTALRDRAGKLLRVESEGRMQRTSRTNDATPHWGGARITNPVTGFGCSAGFTVKGKTTGTYYSTTAGHCGGNGGNWYSTIFYGELAGKAD